MSVSEAILAYRALNGVEARALAAHLENEGIEARVLGEALQGAYGGVDAGGMTTAEVWIAAADFDSAKAVIAQWQAENAQRRSQWAEAHTEPEVIANEIPRTLQFSVATMLWAMTAVAVLSTLVLFRFITKDNWHVWVCMLPIVSLMAAVLQKAFRKAFFWEVK